MKRLRPRLRPIEQVGEEAPHHEQYLAMLNGLLAIPETQRSNKQMARIWRLRSAVSVKARLRPRPT